MLHCALLVCIQVSPPKIRLLFRGRARFRARFVAVPGADPEEPCAQNERDDRDEREIKPYVAEAITGTVLKRPRVIFRSIAGEFHTEIDSEMYNALR